ncbi:MAG: membrane protein insertase YidC [Chromatiales bacterium]|jgi:YidC/Oxa1 family membrane protein insertase
MDNYRLLLIFAVAFLAMMIWQQWQVDYGPKSAEETSAEYNQNAIVETPTPENQSVPDAPTVSSNDVASTPAPVVEVGTTADQQHKKIQVETDTFSILIDSRGGSIVKASLKQYPLSLDRPETEFPLMTENPASYYVAQSGLISSDKALAPTHDAIYSSAQDSYSMSAQQDELTIDLHWMHKSGIKVTKRFSFQRGSYLVNVQHLVSNESQQPWSGRVYQQLQRAKPADDGQSAFIYTYTGGAIYSAENKYEKIDFDEISDADLNRDIKGGWLAMLQHYFVSAWVPAAEQLNHYYSKALNTGRYVLGAYSPAQVVAPGSNITFESKLFAGPKLQHQLEAISEGLELTVDYGWLTIIAKPLFWILEKLHAIFSNWGWAIIFLTVLVKLAFYKLSETSYKSMANMRKVAPRLQSLKERYGDDKQRLNQAMMEMYKKEKINPLGGCLPMLVQIPVFIALYWVLLESVELRQAPWILWIDDLSIKDPYFVLPLLMGITMFVQQKLNPPPPDPMQAKIMMSLPIVFTVFFAFFPSGLVLYWFVNNLLSITQQWYITRKIEQAAH